MNKRHDSQKKLGYLNNYFFILKLLWPFRNTFLIENLAPTFNVSFIFAFFHSTYKDRFTSVRPSSA
jgi:hypothetical protein